MTIQSVSEQTQKTKKNNTKYAAEKSTAFFSKFVLTII